MAKTHKKGAKNREGSTLRVFAPSRETCPWPLIEIYWDELMLALRQWPKQYFASFSGWIV